MKKLIVANWKENPQSQKEAEIIFKGIATSSSKSKKAEVVICPPFPFLFISSKLKLKSIKLGAQSTSVHQEGAHTGQVSTKMITSLKASYVIVGHSEQRAEGENNIIINKKLTSIFKEKLTPILCVGESARDLSGSYLEFIRSQLKECLASIPKAQAKNMVIAYEPLWAIGSSATREATAEEFTEMKIFIRKTISDLYDSKTAHSIRILYGGSVHKENARSFLVDGGADGLLVGRDSLTINKFSAIIGACE